MNSTASDSATSVDPVCGMDVERAAAPFRHDHGGQTFYFCSESCLRKFQADREVTSPAGPGSGEPNPAVAPEGRVLVSWIERTGDRHRGRVDAVLLDGGAALVSWLAQGEAGVATLRVPRFAPDGALGDAAIVAVSTSARSSGFPGMARAGGRVVTPRTRPGSGQRSWTRHPRIDGVLRESALA